MRRERIARCAGPLLKALSFSDVAPRGGFVRNVALLAGSTGVGAALAVIVSPVLTRLYSPEDFGALAVYASLLSLLVTLASARYDTAIPLPEDKETAVSLLVVSLGILLLTTLLTGLATMLFADRLVIWLNCPGMRPYVWLLPLGILGGGAYQALSFWALRRSEFSVLARTRLSQTSEMVAAQVGLGMLRVGPLGLLLGDVIGRVGGVIALLRFVWTDCRDAHVTVESMRKAMVRYAKFPLLTSFAALLTAAGTQVPFLVLSKYFGAATAGLYSIASRVLGAPVTLVGQAVGQAFFAKAAILSRNPARLSDLTERTGLAMLALGLPIFGPVALEGPNLFGAVLGEKWRTAGVFAQILSPWFLLWLVSRPLSNLLTVREWQGTTLTYSALECGVQMAALFVGIRLHSVVLTITLLAGAASILALVTTNRFFRAGYTSGLRFLKQAFSPVLVALSCLSAAALIGIGHGLTPVVIKLSVFLISYLGLAWKLRLFARLRAA